MIDCNGFAAQGTYPNERRCTLCASVDAAAAFGGVVGSGMETVGAVAVVPSAADKNTKTLAKPCFMYFVQMERLLFGALRLHAASGRFKGCGTFRFLSAWGAVQYPGTH